MSKLMLTACIVVVSFVASAQEVNYQVGQERWDIALLQDTCPEELAEAIEFVKNSKKDGNKYETELPDDIGYEYFKIKFFLKDRSDQFIYEFRYWTEDDQHSRCTRVEPEDYIY